MNRDAAPYAALKTRGYTVIVLCGEIAVTSWTDAQTRAPPTRRLKELYAVYSIIIQEISGQLSQNTSKGFIISIIS